MDTTTDWPDLAPLAESYDILGELYARPDARTFVGKRRADGEPVLVVLPRVPEGDERNALTLFAADVNLLAGLEHPALVPIIESRWIDKNTFAVVTARPDDATLEELLERGEEFPPARAAAILREVNGLLEWARAEKVVHRAVDLSTVYVDEASDDVRASFVVRPIPLSGAPTEEGDAHTIALLARAMLAGSARPLNENDETLAQRRHEQERRAKPYTPADRVRPVSAALRAYASMATSASDGAYRRVPD